ncbi:MAG: hypothetical protein HKP12_12835 [Gammaproteobacteria bacterium]|nr:hypothetical protein [Gammaproteobacteria bacterium]
MQRRLIIFSCTLTLIGCTNHRIDEVLDSTSLSSTKAQTFVYECADGFRYVARIEADKAWVFLPDKTLALSPVSTADGRAYAMDNYSFLIQGDQASLASDQVEHTNCRNNHAKAIWEHAKLNGIDFRALGNEPGWYLEISKKTALKLVTDYGQRSYRFNASTIEADQHSRTTVYKASNADDRIAVTITGTSCQDSMSGETFSATVSVVLNGTSYSGCGRALH